MTTTAHSRPSAPVPPAVPKQEPPPYLLAGLVVLGVLLLYILTLAPTTQFWDTSEYIAAAYVLGIPHPPGNPLFVMVAHVWGDLLGFVGHYAARINLFAAATSAVAAGCWFLVGERWMRSFVPARWPRRLAALAGALVGATAFTVWNQSVVNEKVYTVSLLSIALVLWLIVRWDDQPEGDAHDHHLLVIVYLLALTSTNHMMGVLVGPVVAVLLFPPFKTRRPGLSEARAVEWAQWGVFCAVLALLLASGMESVRIIMVAAFFYVAALVWAAMARKWGFALVMLGVAVVGVSVYVFLPIRAAHFPPINEGEPTTWDALWSVLTREQYGKLPISQRQSSLVAQVANWLQYFSWQFGRDFSAAGERVMVVLFGSLGLMGAVRHWRADKRSAAAMTVLVGTLTALLIFYLNFKYGYSLYRDQFPDPDLHEVRERDYFYIASFAVWGIWVGMGLAVLMEWVRDFLRDRVPDDARRWTLATPVLLLALIPLFGNFRSASRAGETLARDFAADLLNSVEPYGILVTAGDNDTFPLWYAQEVEHIRQDVTVVNLSLSNTDWYLRQLQRRPLADFDSAAAPAIYQGKSWPKPATPLMSFTEQQLATLNLFYMVERPTGVSLGPVTITLDPERMGRTYVERADVAVLQIIKDHLGRRPIYFSRTVGDYAERLDLGEYVEGHGFARVLRAQPVTASDSVQNVSVLGMVNMPRTKALLFDTYNYQAAARARPRGWVDRPSEGILTTYGLLYQAIALPLRDREPELAARALAIADSIFRNTEIALLSPGREGAESPD